MPKIETELTVCLILTIWIKVCVDKNTGVNYWGQSGLQIDLVPTLSILLGLPIPHSSLGLLHPEAMMQSSVYDKLRAAFVNSQQILKIANQSLTNVLQGMFIVHFKFSSNFLVNEISRGIKARSYRWANLTNMKLAV